MDETLKIRLVPVRHRIDVDAYYKMAEVGILIAIDVAALLA